MAHFQPPGVERKVFQIPRFMPKMWRMAILANIESQPGSQKHLPIEERYI